MIFTASDKITEEQTTELRSLEKVSNGKLFAYSAGLAGQNVSYSYISGWLFYYLENIRGISPKISGLITGLSRVWDSINDPIVGAMVDKHKFKNGEKLRPILKISPPIIGLLAAMMFLPINAGNTVVLAIICAAYFFWDLTYSFQDVALWGMVAVSSPSSQERARVAQWVSIGAGAGSVVGGFFQTFRSAVNGLGFSDLYTFAIFGVLFGLGGELLSAAAYKMEERVETPKSEESIFEAIFILKNNKKLLLISVARYFKDIFGTILPWAYFFESRESFDLGFAQFSGGNMQVVYSILTGAVGAAAMLFATRIAKKVGGMKRLLILAEIFNIVCRVLSFFVGFDSPAKIIAVMAIMSIANIPVNSMDIAHRSLTADSIDYVEYKTGKRTEGISFSIQNFISKLSSATVQLINGFVLSALGHDNKKQGYEQSTLYLNWQWPIFMLGPVIGAVIYTIVISFIDDDKEKNDRIEAELFERRRLQDIKEEQMTTEEEVKSNDAI